MGDLFKIASAIANDDARIRARFGKVVSVQNRSITVTIGGSSTSVSGVKYLASVAPAPGSVVILLTDGSDVFALGHSAAADLTIAPRVYRTGDQTLTTGVDAAVSWQAVSSDTWGMWSAGSPTRVTAVVAGRYTATAQVRFAANGTGFRQAYILKGGTTAVARANVISAAAASPTAFTVTAPAFDLNVGEYVELWVSQNSGGNLALSQLSTHEPALTVSYLGP